jgi:ubiquinone/menaquinone biosynthesis C-methylase UbiE
MSEPSGWYQAGFGGGLAEAYERYMVPAIFGPWAGDLLDTAALRPGERVLDVACGTGVIARAAAPRVGPAGAVVGLDLNPPMLAVAAALPPVAGAAIAWQTGDVLALPFTDQSFDVIICQQGLQFFPDRSAALREMHRVLAPSGRVALAVWRPIEHSPGFAVLAEALDRHIGSDLLTGPFSLGDATVLRALLEQAGFHDVMIRAVAKTLRFPSVEAFVTRYVAASPLAEPVGQADEPARAALVAHVGVGLAAYLDADGLAFPIENHLVTASGGSSA